MLKKSKKEQLHIILEELMNNAKYQDCLNYMFSQLPMYQRIGPAAYKTDLSNTLKLCNYFGNPQRKLKCIHIAGTNGKTSTSHFIASVLQKAGYKTGLYTSPHLIDFRERIIVNGNMIDEDYVVNFVESNKDFFNKIHPSFFEMTVAMAFMYFLHKKVDYAVIEVGLGGRLDSTNVISPLVCAITNIGFDHMQFLGNTLPEIASEKAGIIKEKVPVIIGETQYATKTVFLNKANEMNAPIVFADKVVHISCVNQSVDNLNFKAKSDLTGEEYDIKSALTGHYEVKNITTVLATLEVLSKQVKIPKNAIIEGLNSSILRGRWEILETNPLVVCDTGHNAEGIAETLNMISYVKYDKLHVVFGAVSDKCLDKTVNMFPKNAIYYFCKPNIPRGMEVKILAEKFETAGIKGISYMSCMEALNAAKKIASPNDLIYIGGSTFVVAEILTEITNCHALK